MASGGSHGKSLRLDHIGIAVEDMEAAREQYARLLDLSPSPVEEVPAEKVRVSFFDLDGCRIELLEATTPDSPIRRFLEKGRSGVHHVSISLSEGSIGGLLANLTERGVEILEDRDGEKLRAGSGETDVLFVHPRSAAGVLIEFSQKRGAEGR